MRNVSSVFLTGSLWFVILTFNSLLNIRLIFIQGAICVAAKNKKISWQVTILSILHSSKTNWMGFICFDWIRGLYNENECFQDLGMFLNWFFLKAPRSYFVFWWSLSFVLSKLHIVSACQNLVIPYHISLTNIAWMISPILLESFKLYICLITGLYSLYLVVYCDPRDLPGWHRCNGWSSPTWWSNPRGQFLPSPHFWRELTTFFAKLIWFYKLVIFCNGFGDFAYITMCIAF